MPCAWPRSSFPRQPASSKAGVRHEFPCCLSVCVKRPQIFHPTLDVSPVCVHIAAAADAERKAAAEAAKTRARMAGEEQRDTTQGAAEGRNPKAAAVEVPPGRHTLLATALRLHICLGVSSTEPHPIAVRPATTSFRSCRPSPFALLDPPLPTQTELVGLNNTDTVLFKCDARM